MIRSVKHSAVWLSVTGILATSQIGPTVHAEAPQSPRDVVPVADYHVHLLGPYALPVQPPLPPVQVTPEIQSLLDRRAALYGRPPDVSAIAEVFAPGALLLDDQVGGRWMTDLEGFAPYFGLFQHWPTMKLVPHRFEAEGATAYVAGTVQTATGATSRNFLIALGRDPEGAWRIASESATTRKPPPYIRPITADRLIESMDKAGIQRALVLSEAFWVGRAGSERIPRLVAAPSRVEAVRLENDWAAAQVAHYPDRLVLACGVNPLEDHAIAEMTRCSNSLGSRAIKVNVSDGGDNIDFREAADVAKLRDFFSAADELRMPIVIHLGSMGGFGRDEVRVFLNEVVRAAPNIPIQIAHMSSGLQQADALREFATARKLEDPLAENLYFDLSVGSFADLPADQGQFLAEMIRSIGLEHVLYASDELPGDHHAPTWKHWLEMRQTLPLTQAEFSAIADNVTPYMR